MGLSLPEGAATSPRSGIRPAAARDQATGLVQFDFVNSLIPAHFTVLFAGRHLAPTTGTDGKAQNPAVGFLSFMEKHADYAAWVLKRGAGAAQSWPKTFRRWTA